MVHALRPNPKNNIQEGWRILDFFSSHPESTNLLTYLLGDEGEPSSGVHSKFCQQVKMCS